MLCSIAYYLYSIANGLSDRPRPTSKPISYGLWPMPWPSTCCQWQSIADQIADETVAGESAELLGTASGTVSSRSDKKPSLELLSAVRAVGPQAIG